MGSLDSRPAFGVIICHKKVRLSFRAEQADSFPPRSLLRTRRPAQSRNLSLLFSTPVMPYLSTAWREKPTTKYEIIIYWSQADEAFIAEVPELPAQPTERPTRKLWPASKSSFRSGLKPPRNSADPSPPRAAALPSLKFFFGLFPVSDPRPRRL